MIQAEANEKRLNAEIERLGQLLEGVSIAREAEEARASAIHGKYREVLQGRAMLEETLLSLDPAVLGFTSQGDNSDPSDVSSSSSSDDSSRYRSNSDDSSSTSSSNGLSSVSAMSEGAYSAMMGSSHPSLGGIGPSSSTPEKKKEKKAKSSTGDIVASRLSSPGGRTPALTASGSVGTGPVVVVAGTNFRYKQLDRLYPPEKILEFQKDAEKHAERVLGYDRNFNITSECQAQGRTWS